MTYAAKFSGLLALLRLASNIRSSPSLVTSLNINEHETSAVLAAADTLLSDDVDGRDALLSSLLSGDGELQGTPCKSRPNGNGRIRLIYAT